MIDLLLPKETKWGFHYMQNKDTDMTAQKIDIQIVMEEVWDGCGS